MIFSRHAERMEAPSASWKGFTLPEVCVAMAVFLIGMTALLGGWNFFDREVADERLRMNRFYNVHSAMESLVIDKVPCADSLFMYGRTVARLMRVPGKRLAWAVVELDGVSLKRLVRCQ